MTPTGRRRWLVRGLLAALTAAALAFFIDAYLDVQRQGGLLWPTAASWPWILASLAIGVAHVVAMGCAFAWLIGSQGFHRVVSIFLFSQAAKYVPGKIWGVVAQQALMGQQSRLSQVFGANIALAAILICSQLALALAASLYGRTGAFTAGFVGATVCVIAGAFAALLQHLHRARGWRVLVPWARPGVGLVTGVSSAVSLLLTALAWAALFGGGLGYRIDDVATWTAVSGASFVAGMLSVLPGGLGIREAAFVAFSAHLPSLAPAEAPMLALLTRAWLLAIDAVAVILGVAGLLAMRVRKRT